MPPALQTYTPHKVELNIPSTLKTGNIYSNLGKEGDIYDFTLNIVGLKDGASLDITKGVVSGNIERIKKDGIYKIYQPLESSLDIGFNLNNYTQIAFKNLGIYNNQILSKDDCIKAYNYLQTLKAK